MYQRLYNSVELYSWLFSPNVMEMNMYTALFYLLSSKNGVFSAESFKFSMFDQRSTPPSPTQVPRFGLYVRRLSFVQVVSC